MQLFQVFFSNQVEKLYEQMKENLFGSNSSPFDRRLIIVPSPAMKSWLMLKMAQDPDLGIAAGMEIAYLDDSIFKLLEKFSEKPSLPTPLETAFAVEWEMRQGVESGGSQWDALRNYFGLNEQKKLPIRSTRRLVALSSSMAALFQRYAKYGNGMVAEWDNGKAKGWQQELWQRVFKEKNYLYHALKTKLNIPKELKLSIHLFSLSFLPRLYHDFLKQIGKKITVNYYMLSPCEVFWSDIKSDRERIHVRKFLEQKDAQTDQLENLDTYLKDCNPLLANFGRLGREMAQMLEEGDLVTHEDYAQIGSTLLKSVQNDLLLLRNPSTEGKINLSGFDKTIQVHAAPTALREIEVLRDLLLGIFDKHQHDDEPITPRDVIVMAPDIMKYEPFIKMVFQPPKGIVDVQIMDLRMPAQSPLIQAFMLFLELPESRWESDTLLQFLEQPTVRKKQGWTLEELIQLRSWVEKCDIRWGLDAQHRSELVAKLHEKESSFDPYGTWIFGLTRMVRTLVSEGDEAVEIDLPQAEFLGKLIRYLEELKNDSTLFLAETMMPLKEWSEKLKGLFEKYFSEFDAQEEVKVLMRLFASLAKSGRNNPEATYSFISIKKHLYEALTSQSTSYRESHLNAVRFCSLLPMRAIPAKVVVLLGMEEGAFPRLEENFSLNLLKEHKEADYCPSQTDFDRYLFLEALISARDYFILSYADHKEEGFKEQPPSLLVTELLGYLDRSYEIDDKKISDYCLRSHPYKAFDKRYFVEGADFPSYSLAQFKNACAFYQTDKEEGHRFIPHFYLNKPSELPKQVSLTVADLSAAISNPLKLYFTKGLGFYVENQRDEKIDVKLTMNQLEKYQVLNESFKVPLETLLTDLELKGKLPEGPFRDRTKAGLKEEIETIHEELKELQINLSEVVTLELTPHSKTPHLEKGTWKLPPLRIPFRETIVELTGTIDTVSKEGLLVNAKAEPTKIFKVLAKAIVMLAIAKKYSLEIKPYFVTMKCRSRVPMPQENPDVLLQQLLEFYFNVKENPSPLLPEWIETFLKESPDDVVDTLQANAENKFHPSFNAYSKWMMRGTTLPQVDKLLGGWTSPMEKLFTPFLQHKEKKRK